MNYENLKCAMENGVATRRLPQKMLLVLLFILLVIIVVHILPRKEPSRSSGLLTHQNSVNAAVHNADCVMTYNYTYPLTPPIKTNSYIKFSIGIVADQDQSSKDKDKSNSWNSILKKGTLTYDSTNYRVTVDWSSQIHLSSRVSEGGRGAELSELIVYNGKLLTVDDRSGLIYEILGDKLIPWVKLNDGPGNVAKGFKGEWMTVKGNLLYVGSLGKEWTNSAGEYVNDHPQYVKIIDPRGYIEHQPWVDRYIALRSACGINPPGYLIHESGCWSSVHNKWFFLPRRASHESYNDVDDEHRGTNLLITADNVFKHVEAKKITKLNVFRGFSSFKFIPGTNDQIIVALKSQETKGTISTYILSFDLNGKMLMDETNVGNYKFEGIEFL